MERFGAEQGQALGGRMALLSDLWGLSEQTLQALLSGGIRRGVSAPAGDALDDVALVGDGLVSGASVERRRWAEVDAPRSQVWPWLAQMGRGAGLYGWPRLESYTVRSADYLLGGLAEPRPGELVNGCLELVDVVPGREIVWRFCGRTTLKGYTLPDTTLDYALVEADGKTRIIARLRGSDAGLTATVAEHLFDVIDFLLPRHQVERIASYAQSYSRRLSEGSINRGRVLLHQAASCLAGP